GGDDDDDDNGGGAPPPTEGGGSVPGGFGGGSAFAHKPVLRPSSRAFGQAVLSLTMPALMQGGSFAWSVLRGATDFYDGPASDETLSVTRTARTWFDFRGAQDTFPQIHPAGTQVMPVFRVLDTRVPEAAAGGGEPAIAQRPGWGWPGAGDEVFVMDESVFDIGLPNTVHRAVRPVRQHLFHDWVPDFNYPDAPFVSQAAASAVVSDLAVNPGFGNEEIFEYEQRHHLVAFREAYFGIGIPSVEFQLTGTLGLTGIDQQYDQWTEQSELDMRTVSRLVKFPSGELPRAVQTVRVGQDIFGLEASAPAVVDEVLVKRYDTGGQNSVIRAQHILGNDLAPGDASITLAPGRARTAFGEVPIQNTNAFLPQDAGLVRIGDELIAYTGVTDTSTLLIPPGGRGFFGTAEQPHSAGEVATIFSQQAISRLIGNLDDRGHVVQVEDADGFGGRGTVRIGRELMHFTTRLGTDLMMPRTLEGANGSSAGERGIFRARFGTEVQAHQDASAVVLWPTRYWDRYELGVDSPELHYLGMELSKPEAWVRSLGIEHTDASAPGARIGILVRSDPSVPWTADPDETDGLQLAFIDDLSGRPFNVARQSASVEARLFVEFLTGCFNPDGPFAHGWKEVPTIEQVAIDYLAPGRVFARSDR
ncbi:MAG: hypothetical protein AAFZ65_14640, partial [Planctomycetota bacterium]